MAQYAMAIDLKRCIGCRTCVVSCKQANNVPEGIFWNHVFTVGGDSPDTAGGTYPNVSMSWMPFSCQHCGNPACIKSCPVGATFKDKETGIVRQDYDRCIGCRMCIAACPYTGVRSFNWEKPKYAVDVRLGDAEAPEHQKHTVEKCTFCYHRISKGEKPACMVLCPGRARYYGDIQDANSDVSKALQGRQYKQLLPSMGTRPSVYYLI